MSAAIESRGGNDRSLLGSLTKQQGTVAAEADELQHSAEDAEAEQQALLETSTIESDYLAALNTFVEAKHEQVARIEGRLEGIIEQQEAKLHRIESSRPGLLSMPGKRAGWQGQLDQQQALLQKLHGRLEVVREVKEGMGLHGPRVDELAARKLRHHERELTKEWDDFRAAQRGHQELLRQQEKKRRKQAERLGGEMDSPAMVQGHSLSVSRSSN